MGEAAILDIPKGAVPPSAGIGTLGAFFKPLPTCDDRIVRADERLILELLSVLERQLIAVLRARSIAEFKAARETVMPRYVRALRALSDTVTNLVPAEVIEKVSEAITGDLAADLEAQREFRLGDQLAEQAVFSLWTIRRIGTLIREISFAGRVREDKRSSDNKLRHEYHVASLWAQFHMDLLFAAIRFDMPIAEEVRETICDGLRAAVNAYVIMKDALALRQSEPAADTEPLDLPWDEEDEELLTASMRDLNVGLDD